MTRSTTRALMTLGCGLAFALAATAGAAGPSGVESANPMIGTAEHGHVYPGATVPFGMVQLSPDTRLGTWDGCSGYHYSDKAILGFSHTHLSGTGCGDLADIRVVPLVLKDGVPAIKPEKEGYHLAFSHKDESAKPGYYCVTLQDPAIKVELTASAHAGFHKYTFPAGTEAALIFDLVRGVSNQPLEGEAAIDGDRTLTGYRRSKGWAADKTFFFVAEFSQPFAGCSFEVDGKQIANASKAKGKQVMASLTFGKANEPIMVKVGLSATSIEAAKKNLAAEISGWDFAGATAAPAKAWSDFLDRIDATFSNPADRTTFYTALYHAGTAPVLFNDVDGGYRGLDGKVHPAEGFQNYCTFSLWDTFRAEHPLLTIVQPQRVDDFICTMLAHYKQFKHHSLPVWSLAGNETWCMIGNHAIPVIVEAYAKGFRRFDAEAVYQAMRDTLTFDRNMLGEYRKRGYVPSANKDQSVSRTLEYVYDDWCMSRMAAMLGKTEDAKYFAEQANNYKNVFDPAVGFARGKKADGKWREPFDPRELAWSDFTEATSWNYTFFVLHDVPGLIQLIGGDQAFVAKLEKMYSEDSTLLAAVPDMTGLIGQYIHGNEPCHHVAYLSNYAGAAWKTQEQIRNIMKKLYTSDVGGICGNDDCGQMSAWYVLSAMGFYSVSPASGVYVIGSPLVDKAVIHLDAKYQSGRDFTIIAKNNSPQNVYVQSATLNGKPLTRSWFTHAELTAGGELVLEMGPQPNPSWAQRAEDRPPAVAP